MAGKAMALRCDVADEAAVERAFADTVSAFGRVDSCFANAGVSGRGGAAGFAKMATAEWRRVMSVNLDGAFFTPAHRLAPHDRARRRRLASPSPRRCRR
jgi:NAD(P)-dependent dehydrogenase (short-subunit alcohol dehydrogenase family)